MMVVEALSMKVPVFFIDDREGISVLLIHMFIDSHTRTCKYLCYRQV